MRKFLSGFLIGFFLAAAIMFGFIQVALGPSYGELKQAEQYAQGVYLITHSGAFASVQGFVSAINNAADTISAIPLVGAAVNVVQVPQYAQSISLILEASKSLSESTLMLIRFNIGLLEMSGPVLLISVAMIAVGVALYLSKDKKGEKKAAAKQAKKRGRK